MYEKYCSHKDWECPAFNEDTGRCEIADSLWCEHDFDYIYDPFEENKPI